MPMPEALADLSPLSLSAIALAAADQQALPVDRWNPSVCGSIDIRIARDGTWFHEGAPIRREAMVRLFSSILRREPDGSHVLVTPAEKLTISVEDAAFMAVEMKTEGQGEARRMAFRLKTGDLIVAGPDHSLRAAGTTEAPAHYLGVRGGLEARLSRAVYYELAELALAEDHAPLGLWSEGCFFALEPAL
jgi:uncharacterized protein